MAQVGVSALMQSDLICALRLTIVDEPSAAPNGGSARDYLPGFAWFGAPLWSNARAAVRMFIHRRPRRWTSASAADRALSLCCRRSQRGCQRPGRGSAGRTVVYPAVPGRGA